MLTGLAEGLWLQEKVSTGRGKTACRLSPPMLPMLRGVLARDIVGDRLSASPVGHSNPWADTVLQPEPESQ